MQFVAARWSPFRAAPRLRISYSGSLLNRERDEGEHSHEILPTLAIREMLHGPAGATNNGGPHFFPVSFQRIWFIEGIPCTRLQTIQRRIPGAQLGGGGRRRKKVWAATSDHVPTTLFAPLFSRWIRIENCRLSFVVLKREFTRPGSNKLHLFV